MATDSEDVETVATPAARLPVPIEFPPSKNVTVPVGVPAGLVTVAENVTVAPKVDGFGAEVPTVVLSAFWTTCESVEDAEPLKFSSPPYVAVTECVATDSDDVEKVATPLLLSVPVPIVDVPSRNVTVPPGVVPGPETVAEKVTGWPNFEGLRLEESDVADAAFVTVRVMGPVVRVPV
jgi:hypothetical protein